MVSQTAESPRADEADGSVARDSATEWRTANRGGIRRLVVSTVRLADLQLKIWLTQAKITLARLLTSLLLYAIAGVLAILGIVFLFIGLFRVLTDVIGLRPVWAFLIFAGFTFAATGAVILIAQQTLGSKAGEPDQTKPRRDKPR